MLGSEVSPEFHQAMTQEILRTELMRIKALIVTTVLLGTILLAVYLFAPEAVSKVWHGNLKPSYLYSVMVPFILFELWVHGVISRHIKLHRDVPVVRRYLGALIETSMPTIALALHIDSMGPAEALGFVVPMAYFIFIILSTLRLDFWLSTFTGFVAAAELFAWRCSITAPAAAIRRPSCSITARAASFCWSAACWRARSACSCAASSRPASWRPPRATASPICSASTSRRRWSSG